MSTYAQSNKPVLLRPVESDQGSPTLVMAYLTASRVAWNREDASRSSALVDALPLKLSQEVFR